MAGKFASQGWLVLVLALLAGCSTSGTKDKSDDVAVKDAFHDLEKALKSKDVDKIWALIDSGTQAEAAKNAKEIQDHYAKATPEKKTELEKQFGLAADQLANLTGQGFLKTEPFQSKNDEIPGSTIEKVEIQGTSAIVHYKEADGDPKKLTLKREDSKWKAVPFMPKFKL